MNQIILNYVTINFELVSVDTINTFKPFILQPLPTQLPLNDIFFSTPKIHIFVVILSTTQESTEPSKTSMMEFFGGK